MIDKNTKKILERIEAELAVKFDNVQKCDRQWRGRDVYYPCGPNGEPMYIGYACIVVSDDEVQDFYSIKAKQILEEMYGKDYEEDEEPDEDEDIDPEDIYNS